MRVLPTGVDTPLITYQRSIVYVTRGGILAQLQFVYKFSLIWKAIVNLAVKGSSLTDIYFKT
jgi:hypothetical protein